MGKAVFLPLPLSSFLTASAKAICVRGGILVHQTLTAPQAGMSQKDCSSLNRFPSAFSRGLGPASASPLLPQSIGSLGQLSSSWPRPITRSRHAPSQPPAELVLASEVPRKMGSLGSGA